MPITFEYIRPNQNQKKDLQNANFKNLKKRMNARKKNVKKGKHVSHVRYNDSSESDSQKEDEEAGQSEYESDSEAGGSFYVKFKEGIPPLVKKDMACEDLWLLMKRPMVTNQNLSDVPDVCLARSAWHFHNKQQKMKVTIIGDSESLKFKADSFRYAFKSINLTSYSDLIENLIQFRERSNPYVDSMLGIANSKSKFKVIRECDPEIVEGIRQATCMRFKLNSDQEFVLNEVTKWFLPKNKLLYGNESQESNDENKGTQNQNGDEFDILGIEDALS